MKVWTTILIEDEEPARQRLRRLLSVYDDFAIIGEAVNGVEGLALVDEVKPELIFLDVEMPGLSGFEMLAKLKHRPKVIFTTAYEQYAIKAFEEESTDYLLKPIETDRLEKTIKRIRQSAYQIDTTMRLDNVIRQLQSTTDLRTLTVKIGDRILLIKLDDVVYLEAEDKYVFLSTTDGSRYLTEFTIGNLIAQLPDRFLRIHRSYIINTEYIKEMRKGFSGTLVFLMDCPEGRKLTSSRPNNEMLKKRFRI